MLAALNECTEWGQVFILDSLALYTPCDGREAESIIERVTPRLQHANSAVVLSAVKVMIKYMDLITSQEALKALYKKMAPPLVTLLSSEPEIQSAAPPPSMDAGLSCDNVACPTPRYVALRNINLIVQKRPSILAHEIKVRCARPRAAAPSPIGRVRVPPLRHPPSLAVLDRYVRPLWRERLPSCRLPR